MGRSDDSDLIERARARAHKHSASGDAPASSVGLYGDFAKEWVEDGHVVLCEADRQFVSGKIEALRRAAPLFPSLARGVPIDAEYDIRTRNFSTKTRIVTLEDGRKLFAVHAYAMSSVHRVLDGLMKWAAGLRMRKVSRGNWKRAFEEKSNIPIVACAWPDTVLMPYLPNVNAYDVFANDRDIRDFGECDWAKDIDAEKKRELSDRIVDELRRVHGMGKAWGEAILPNVILLRDQTPVICDPEVRYDAGMDFREAKARDLKDLIQSIAGALARSEGIPVEETVPRLLDRYGDREVTETLRSVVARKRGWLARLAFPYERVRSGATDNAEYARVLQAIRLYSSTNV